MRVLAVTLGLLLLAPPSPAQESGEEKLTPRRRPSIAERLRARRRARGDAEVRKLQSLEEVPTGTFRKLDIRGPDIQRPDIRRPDIQRPDIQRPVIQGPNIRGPDFSRGIPMPNHPAPGGQAPGFAPRPQWTTRQPTFSTRQPGFGAPPAPAPPAGGAAPFQYGRFQPTPITPGQFHQLPNFQHMRGFQPNPVVPPAQVPIQIPQAKVPIPKVPRVPIPKASQPDLGKVLGDAFGAFGKAAFGDGKSKGFLSGLGSSGGKKKRRSSSRRRSSTRFRGMRAKDRAHIRNMYRRLGGR